MVDSFLGSIGIIYNQLKSDFLQIFLHFGKSKSCSDRNDHGLLQISVYYLSNEILLDGISRLNNDGRVYAGEIVEALGEAVLGH
jgi:hypothetical protein